MKKIVIALSCMAAFSCASNQVEESRTPAQIGNVGTFSTSTGNNVGQNAIVCTAVCEIYVPINTNDAKIKLALGQYSSGRALMVANGETAEVATTKLRNKCAQAAPKYRIFKAMDVDLVTETDSLVEKTYSYDPSQQLNSHNSQEFCQAGVVTEFIHYASGKLVNKDAMKMKLTHKTP